jgi:hypothetical protein
MTPENTKPVTSILDIGSKQVHEADQQAHPRHGKMISIWFFVGCLLTAYGVLILIAGLRDRGSSGREIAMSHLHVQIWWGIGLLLIGLGYVARFRPRPKGKLFSR